MEAQHAQRAAGRTDRRLRGHDRCRPSADLARVFYRQISIIGVSGASRVETEQLLRFMEAADLHPLIDSVYVFEQILPPPSSVPNNPTCSARSSSVWASQ